MEKTGLEALAEKVGRLAEVNMRMNAILADVLKRSMAPVITLNAVPARVSVDPAEVMMACNSCDTIDPFTQENEMGYCRECWAEVRGGFEPLRENQKTEPNRITLFRTKAGWQAKHTDPAVKELFGADTIPTAFTAQAVKSIVVKEIKAWNPGAIVEAIGPENPWDDETLFPRGSKP